VERAQRRPPFRSRRIGYPLSVRGQVRGVQSPLPCFRSTALCSVTPPFPRSGPGEPGSPTSSVLRRRYDFPPARTRSLIVSVPGPTRASCVRVRRSAPDDPGGSSSDPEHLISRRPNPRHDAPVGACGISQVSWRSIPCLCPAPRPRPSRQDLALAILSVLPPANPNRRPQRAHNLEANTGLQHPLSTLHERRHRHPCKTRFRLAGCAFTGRASNPLDRFERFQVTSHSPFQDFSCRKGRLREAALRRAGSGTRLRRALHPSCRHFQQPATVDG
jgi:hypothetical protein